MKETCKIPGQYRRWAFLSLATAAALILQLSVTPAPVAAEDDLPSYARIEEDWALVILDPDSGRASPQVATEMSPRNDSGYFCNFLINHRPLPQLTDGGLQVQAWKDGANVSYNTVSTGKLGTPAETIVWTQYMQRNGSSLKFGISQGTSLTWGALPTLEVSVSDSRSHFQNYRSDYSVQNSAVTYGANRVASLKLLQVRKYRWSNSLGTYVCDVEATPRTIWLSSSLQ